MAPQLLENTVEELAPGVVDAVVTLTLFNDKTGGFLGKPAGVDVDEQLRRRAGLRGHLDIDGIDWARRRKRRHGRCAGLGWLARLPLQPALAPRGRWWRVHASTR